MKTKSGHRKGRGVKRTGSGRKFNKVMHEWGTGSLHSGSKRGPIVRNQRQAIAIAFSEQRKAGRSRRRR